jgi:hypothetical protein
VTDRNGWINAAMNASRADRPVLGRRVLFDMYYAVMEEAMRRDEFAVAAEYQQMVSTLWDEFRSEKKLLP